MKSRLVVTSALLSCGLGVAILGGMKLISAHAASSDVVPLNILPQLSLEDAGYLSNAGYVGHVHNGAVAKNASDILNAVTPWVQRFKGTRVNIVLQDLTMSGRQLSPTESDGDPSIQSEEFQNVPCYVVRIDGASDVLSDGPLNSDHSKHTDATYVIVDANNVKILDVFSIAK